MSLVLITLDFVLRFNVNDFLAQMHNLEKSIKGGEGGTVGLNVEIGKKLSLHQIFQKKNFVSLNFFIFLSSTISI